MLITTRGSQDFASAHGRRRARDRNMVPLSPHLAHAAPSRRDRNQGDPIDRLAAILRLDMPPARSLSTSRILRMGYLYPGMPCSPSKEPRQCRFEDHPTALVTPSTIARNEWSRSIGTPGRNQLGSVVAISRYAHPVLVKAHSGACRRACFIERHIARTHATSR
jgi:hypothetical protein